jgi:hypothetical protein
MKTECTTEQMEFHQLGRRAVIGRFDGGKISSDAGGVLLREVEPWSICFTALSDYSGLLIKIPGAYVYRLSP